MFYPLPAPLAKSGWRARLLARFGLVALARYTDRCAVCESLEVRLESAESAVDSQRERLAIANLHLSSAESAREALAEENSELRANLDEAERECAVMAEALRKAKPAVERDRLLRGCGSAVRDADAVRAKRGIWRAKDDGELFESLAVLLDRQANEGFYSAGDPAAPEAVARWHLGWANGLQAFKVMIAEIVASEEEPK